MSGRPIRSRLIWIITALLAIGLTAVNPGTLRAKCPGGDRARIRYVFERIIDWTNTGIGSASNQARYLAKTIVNDYLQHVALWWLLQVQSREDLKKLLTRIDTSASGVGTQKQLKSALEAHWMKARAIILHFSTAEVDTQKILGDASREMADHWLICQAVKSARPELCDIVVAIGPHDRREDCRSAVATFGILYAGRCSDEKLVFASEITKTSAKNLKAACQILSAQQSERCRSFSGFTPRETLICLVLTGDSREACKNLQMSEKDCLRTVHTYQASTGRYSVEAWEAANAPDAVLNTAVRAASGRNSCAELTLRQYNQYPQYLSPAISERWYLPPVLP